MEYFEIHDSVTLVLFLCTSHVHKKCTKVTPEELKAIALMSGNTGNSYIVE